MSDKRVDLIAQEDGTFLMRELTAEEIQALEAEQVRQVAFERAHGLPTDQYVALMRRQSGICATCSGPLDIDDSAFEHGNNGSAIYCGECSATLMVRRDRERFGGKVGTDA